MRVLGHILRLTVIGLLLPVAAGMARELPEPGQGAVLREAIEAARAGNWDAAAARAEPIPEAAAVVEWMRLRGGAGDWPAYPAFLARWSDWPGLVLLRRQGETAMPPDTPPEQVLAFFGDALPQTGAGVLRLTDALAAMGRTGDAEAEVVRAWRTLSLGEAEEARLLDRWAALLEPHHEARLDAMLWQGETAAAARAEMRVGAGWRKLAVARIALREMAAGVDARIAAVPEALADDPGLAYERFLWRIRKGRDDDALEMLRARSTSASALGRPDAWAGQRARLARSAMRAGEAALAYEVAARHHLTEGARFAELEWLAGYLALGPLDDPARAAAHFTRFRAAVETPISLGRAGYWLGRAEEARGDQAAARAAYAFGARYQSSFYGQLAAERAGLARDPALAGARSPGDWRRAGFADSSVLAAAALLHHAGEVRLSRVFFEHLAETLDPAGVALLGEAALELEAYHAAVIVGKRAARAGLEVMRPYYPVTPMAGLDLAVPADLALSIARRESEFDPGVVSHAGALGLMQAMPRTAREMARAAGLAFSERRLLSDWRYNARLGATYLAWLTERYGDVPVLIAAAYNAGPSRADAWIAARGDPRRMDTPEAVIDWIEHIPFDETRNYVMRVLESLVVYRARLGGQGPELALGTLLTAG